MNESPGGETLSVREIVSTLLSVAVLLVLFFFVMSVYGVFDGTSKEDAAAIAVLHNLADLINAQEGASWETKTILRFPSDKWVLVGVDEDFYEQGYAEEFDTDCDGACLCLYSVLPDTDPKFVACRAVKRSDMGGINDYLGVPLSEIFLYDSTIRFSFVDVVLVYSDQTTLNIIRLLEN